MKYTHTGQIPIVKTKVWDEEQGTLNGEGMYICRMCSL